MKGSCVIEFDEATDGLIQVKLRLYGSPGLVVIEEDSCSRGRGFKSWHRILDGHFHINLL